MSEWIDRINELSATNDKLAADMLALIDRLPSTAKQGGYAHDRIAELERLLLRVEHGYNAAINGRKLARPARNQLLRDIREALERSR